MNKRLYEIGQRIQRIFTHEYVIHGLYAFLITAVAGVLLPLWAAALLTVVISIGKEILDHIAYEGWSWPDLAGDAVGLLLALGVLLLIRMS
ncbi:MAG: hypothetical protein IAC42_02435 [Spirochaetes bacterium]|uniref:Uncharacterized protein n=1 Tax=Candidatus Aphodenecus pullistercoris TaxID=2840669 RepID=A0A9D9H686_9SPIR|nr:hypothetical protein [Candidatus Aphodenecus pullistercoris]